MYGVQYSSSIKSSWEVLLTNYCSTPPDSARYINKLVTLDAELCCLEHFDSQRFGTTSEPPTTWLFPSLSLVSGESSEFFSSIYATAVALRHLRGNEDDFFLGSLKFRVTRIRLPISTREIFPCCVVIEANFYLSLTEGC